MICLCYTSSNKTLNFLYQYIFDKIIGDLPSATYIAVLFCCKRTITTSCVKFCNYHHTRTAPRHCAAYTLQQSWDGSQAVNHNRTAPPPAALGQDLWSFLLVGCSHLQSADVVLRGFLLVVVHTCNQLIGLPFRVTTGISQL